MLKRRKTFRLKRAVSMARVEELQWSTVRALRAVSAASAASVITVRPAMAAGDLLAAKINASGLERGQRF
jgi:hypothetical protein